MRSDEIRGVAKLLGQAMAGGTSGFDLLNHPEVYAHMRRWFAGVLILRAVPRAAGQAPSRVVRPWGFGLTSRSFPNREASLR
ncbi:MAG: hypothetical protein ACXV5Q_14480 [Frankiaceae bacterium]